MFKLILFCIFVTWIWPMVVLMTRAVWQTYILLFSLSLHICWYSYLYTFISIYIHIFTYIYISIIKWYRPINTKQIQSDMWLHKKSMLYFLKNSTRMFSPQNNVINPLSSYLWSLCTGIIMHGKNSHDSLYAAVLPL